MCLLLTQFVNTIRAPLICKRLEPFGGRFQRLDAVGRAGQRPGQLLGQKASDAVSLKASFRTVRPTGIFDRTHSELARSKKLLKRLKAQRCSAGKEQKSPN